MSDVTPAFGSRRLIVAAGGTVAAGMLLAVNVSMKRKTGISGRGWFIRDVLLPLLAPRAPHSPANLRKRIASDRKRGPGMPSQRLRSRMDFRDEQTDDRTLSLSPQGGPTSSLRVLYLHGGAYVFNIGVVHWKPIADLVERTGGRAVAPLYPLAPEANWLAGIACVERCYRRLVAEVGAHNVVIAGDSAGGGLALALTQRLPDISLPLPVALVLLSPWLDLTLSGAEQPSLAAHEPMLNIDDLREAGRMWAGETSPTDPAVSPLFGNHAALPPTMVFCGTRDLLVSDARRFAATPARPDYREYPGMFHVWVAAPIPEARQCLDEAIAFILEAVGRPTRERSA